MARRIIAARDVWIRSDHWPDAKDLGRWARDIFRLARARTDQQRAIALWQWLHICIARGGPIALEGERGLEVPVPDTLKYLTVYGVHYCDGLSRVMVNAWQSAGAGSARKVVVKRLGHTVAELRYKDADGVVRWHAFDPQQGWYVFSRDGGHIASVAEIDADLDLLLHPVNPPRPYFFAAGSRENYFQHPHDLHNAVWGDAPMPRHRMLLNLRRGERWRRLWAPGPQYWPLARGERPKVVCYPWTERDSLGGGIADGFLGRYVEPYLYRTPRNGTAGTRRCRMPGTVELTYTVPLAGGRFAEGAKRAWRLASEARASARRATVHPTRLHQLGMLIYEVKTPYVIADAALETTVRSGSDPLDMLAIYVSTDGGELWTDVWGTIFARKGRLSPAPRAIRAEFGSKAYLAGKFSVTGKYGYLVRIDFLARRDVGEVGLDALTLRTWCMCNMGALPALLPGPNRVHVTTAEAPPEAKLRVEYLWHERGRGERRVRKLLPARGGSFAVRVGGRVPADVRMREVSLELI